MICLYLFIFSEYFLIQDHTFLAMSNFKKNHWRVVIHFLKKEGLKPLDAAKKLQLHYGDSAPDISIISCWLSRFAAYRESFEDIVLWQQP